MVIVFNVTVSQTSRMFCGNKARLNKHQEEYILKNTHKTSVYRKKKEKNSRRFLVVTEDGIKRLQHHRQGTI